MPTGGEATVGRLETAALAAAVVVVLGLALVFGAATSGAVTEVRLVTGSSMQPTISAPAIVLCDASVNSATELKRGDIAAFHTGDGVVLHRYIGEAETSGRHRFQGDNNPDQVETVGAEAVICRYQAHVGRLGFVLAATLAVVLAGLSLQTLRRRRTADR